MPGNEFILNNWDFNVAATIFEKKTGRSFSEAFESDIVHPLAFQDWRGGTMRRSGRFDVSEHLPYEMSMSVRDMARVGVLMLRNGKWKGLQVVPSDWIAESTARVSKFSNGGGFGYMWWVERQSPSEPALKGAFSARGLNAQRIVVLPALDMVVVHRASTRGKRGMKSADFAKLLDMAVDSRRVK